MLQKCTMVHGGKVPYIPYICNRWRWGDTFMLHNLTPPTKERVASIHCTECWKGPSTILNMVMNRKVPHVTWTPSVHSTAFYHTWILKFIFKFSHLCLIQSKFIFLIYFCSYKILKWKFTGKEFMRQSMLAEYTLFSYYSHRTPKKLKQSVTSISVCYVAMKIYNWRTPEQQKLKYLHLHYIL
jgi:hypothetical protein